MDHHGGVADRAARAKRAPSAAPGPLRRIYYRSLFRHLRRITWDHRGLAPTDVMLASYPRSGNAWLRFMLLEMLVGEASFQRVIAEAPYIGRHRAAPRLLPTGGRLVKTHEPYTRVYKRAIHLVRDPRDVALSYFRFAQRNGRIPVASSTDTAALDRFIDDFVKGHIDPFGTWQGHLLSWTSAREHGDADIVSIRYEDLRADTPAALIGIAKWLGVPLSNQQATGIAERSSLEHMQADESMALELTPQIFARRAKHRELRLVNEGRVAGWRDILDTEQQARFRPMAEGLALMGYAPVDATAVPIVEVASGR